MGEDAGASLGSYRPAWKLRRGDSLWLGDHWTVITAVRVRGDYVLITVEGGQVYRAGYADAVLSRTRPPGLARPYRRVLQRYRVRCRCRGSHRRPRRVREGRPSQTGLGPEASGNSDAVDAAPQRDRTPHGAGSLIMPNTCPNGRIACVFPQARAVSLRVLRTAAARE